MGLMKVDASKVNVLKELPESVRREYEEDPEGFAARRVASMRQTMRSLATSKRLVRQHTKALEKSRQREGQ
jgi:hypothetical protein